MDVEAVAPVPRSRTGRRARGRGRPAWCRGLLLAALWPALAAAQIVPTTFGTIIGNGLLCRDQTDNSYYYQYLATAFGPPYKHDGGAYWFKTDSANLWGVEVSELIVSDDTSALVFLGAVAEVTPEELETAVRNQTGTQYAKIDSSAFPVRESHLGSRLVYFNRKSKIYCAKFKPLPPGAR